MDWGRRMEATKQRLSVERHALQQTGGGQRLVGPLESGVAGAESIWTQIARVNEGAVRRCDVGNQKDLEKQTNSIDSLKCNATVDMCNVSYDAAVAVTLTREIQGRGTFTGRVDTVEKLPSAAHSAECRAERF
jgi:hypothetical protein